VADARLVEQARQGDWSAWEVLVQTHQEAVFRLAYLLLGDADEAADIAQEAFIRAYHSLRRFDESRPLRPWLLRIASNLSRNRRRSLGRYFAALQRFGRADERSTPDVEVEAVRQRDARALWQAVQRLHPSDQQIVYLRYFMDLSVDETAAVLDVAPGTVKSRLHRALRRLREVIEMDFPALRAGGAE
jgi:RNA polymerase sigma-70 factor (ECF subfamily)